MPLLTYTSSNFPFQPFTKIYSADVDQCYNDIKTLLNVTGLDDTNIQTAGLSVNRLKAGTGTAGQILALAGSTPTWSSAVFSNPFEMINLGIATSITNSALTVAVKQSDGATDPAAGLSAVKVGMRSSTATSGLYNERSVTAALSQTISLGTTLGLLASQNNYVYVYLVDSDGAGTMKVALSTCIQDEQSLQNVVAESFTGTISNGSGSTPGIVTANAHGLSNNDCVQLTTTGSLPAGLSTGTNYFLVATSTNTFELSATPGGTAINTSSAGSGTHTVHIANSKLVSSAVYSSAAVRLIGRLKVNLSVAGTWLAPTEVSLITFQNCSENIMAHYKGNSGGGFSSSSSFSIWTGPNTLVTDTHGCGTGAGYFIAPVAGLYSVEARLEFASATTSSSGRIGLEILVNGSIVAGNHVPVATGTTETLHGWIQETIFLNQGDYVSFQASQNLGITGTVNASINSYQSIQRQR